MKDTTEPSGQTVPETPPLFSVNSLRAHLSRVPDPRKARGIRYPLADLLTLLILAKLGGEDSLKGMVDWRRRRETTGIICRTKPPMSAGWRNWIVMNWKGRWGPFSRSPWRENR
jgi:hypothetical protein